MLSIKKPFAYLHPGKSYPSTSISTPELWQTLDHITHEQAVRSAEVRKQKQEEKYKKISPQTGSTLPTHTVKNLNSHVLSPSKVSLLSKGHNFAVTPTSIPTEEIISQIETAIFCLPPEASNDIRQRAVNILRKAKPPSQNISRKERLALRNLKQNNNILILPADKGNVVMYKEDYCNKINVMLSDGSVYRKLKRNPTSSIEKKTSVLLKNSGLPPEIIKYLIPRELSAPRFYGLPKIHKESILLCPIVSNIGGPSYQLARYLTKPLQKLTGHNGSNIKNSIDFVKKITKIKTKPNDILISFDVVSLFTNVPVQDTFKESSLNKPLEPQWDPVSPIIANIFMEHLDGKILKNAPLKPSTWFRYVDNTFVIWSHGKETLPPFFAFLNAQHPNIKFTMEVEQKNQILFLDVLVRRNGDGTLGHRVYRKPTHTDRYLYATSHHHPSQKNSVISSLVYRALTVSEPTFLDEELQHFYQTLIRNGYNSKNINQITKRLKNKISSPNDTENLDEEREMKMTAVLPYLQGTTKRIGRILSKHNIRVIFKLQKKIAQLLPNPKDQRPSLETPGVYKILCVCGKVYIVETGRKIDTRIKEHQRCAKYSHFSQSALAEHWIETGHAVQYDKPTMLAPSQGYFARNYREGLEILKHPDNLNRDKGL
ncbi:uncharacterized protein LOC120358569 [Solenopsis invicta]|uniref:uncharacterized protein LOC120358569 n=1 Tax=Solenopsis invicta TaxID=13686 RepID=UPI00193CE959|nr:uncharacterized protein LOC120358569 [Solenopsis invicta]